MDRDPDERAQSGGASADDEFEAIVAGWRRDGHVPVWPTDADRGLSMAVRSPFEPEPAAAPPPLDEEHFVPPEPPPLPPIGPPALVGLTLLGLGLLLLISPGWLGVATRYGLPLGLVGVAAGLSWLILRLWPDPPESPGDSRSDDGAVL